MAALLEKLYWKGAKSQGHGDMETKPETESIRWKTRTVPFVKTEKLLK